MAGPSIWCRFTTRASHATSSGSSVLVLARFVSSSHVECLSTMLPPGISRLDLTFNGQGPFSRGALQFEHYPKVRECHHQTATMASYLPHRLVDAGTRFGCCSPARPSFRQNTGARAWYRILTSWCSSLSSAVRVWQCHCRSCAATRRVGVGMQLTSREARVCDSR